MKFAPKSADEIAMDGLMQPGVYDFTVSEAEDAVSKKGNEMIKLKLRLWDADGNERTMFDYLMEAIPAKLRGACEVCGLLDSYDRGDLAAFEFRGKSGKVKVAIQPAKDGYDANNSIRAYVMTEATANRDAPPPRPRGGAPASDPFGDDIPFGPEVRG